MRQIIVMIVLVCFIGLVSNQQMVLAQGIATTVSNITQGYPSSQSQDSIRAKVDTIASYYKLDPNLVREIVKQESGFNPNARSRADAMGLMQMIPSTARRFGVKNPYDPNESLHGGCRYFVWLLRRYNGRLDLALAGYNSGEGAVERYGNRVPPYKETQDYVRSITNKYLVKLGVKQTNYPKQVNYPKQANYSKQAKQGKSLKTKLQRPKYKESTISAKTTKEKLDMLETYFKKK